MIPRENPLVAACYAAWHKGAGGWEDIEDELAAVKRKDVEELLKALARLPETEVDEEAIYLSAFCYDAAAEPLAAREELVKRAAYVLQRLLIRRAGPPAPLEVLPLIIHAAERFPLRSGLERYRVVRQIANTPWHGKKALKAARRRQLTTAEQLADRRSGLWEPLAETFVDVARHEEARADYGRAQRALEQAIKLSEASHAELDDWGILVAGQAHCRLAQILRRLGEPDAAQAHFEKAECLLMKSAEEMRAEEHVGLLCRVFARSSELAEERGDYPRAERKIRAAIGLTGRQQGHEWERSDLLGSLVRVVRAHKGEDAAKELLDEILRDRGTGTAAMAGHEGAEELASVEWDSLGTFIRPDFEGEEEREEALSSRGRLVQLLNLPPDLVERKVQELAREEATEAAYKGPVSLPGMTRVGDLHRNWECWRAVQILQQLARVVAKAEDDVRHEPFLKQTDTQVRFRGFTVEDVDALVAVLDRAGQTTDLFVMAGPANEDDGILNYALPEEDYYCGPLPPSHPVDLLVYRQFTGGLNTTRMDLWIAEGVKLLFDALVFGKPDLRRCEMPRGVTTYLDYLLGERDHPPDECGRFFIPTKKHKETCGHDTCETYHGRLQPLEIKLMQRAEELAERDCRDAGCLEDFHEMWRGASMDRDAKAALAWFRKVLKRSSETRPKRQ